MGQFAAPLASKIVIVAEKKVSCVRDNFNLHVRTTPPTASSRGPWSLSSNEDEKWVANAANFLFPVGYDGIQYVSCVITSDKRKMLCAAVDFESR
eukprot:scaffold6868_cov146-Skeletonema_dohrnii-CCMP3373.AAC.1